MQINSESRLILDKFKPRDYQKPLLDALFNRGIKRIIITHPRRAGKDFALFAGAAIRQCLMKPCLVLYVGATFGSVKQTVWDAIDNNGVKFLDYCPPGTVERFNHSEQKIIFRNGSILRCVGAKKHQTSLRGANPTGIILSEYAYYDDGSILDTITPMIAAKDDAWLVIASTPAGQNWFYANYIQAQELPDWYTQVLTVDDTKHMTPEQLENEKRRMHYDLFLQEYYCSFQRGISGAIFGKEIANLSNEGQITHVNWEPGMLVHTAWDIGLSTGNQTCIIFFQVAGEGSVIRIIDCYSSDQLGLDHYASILQEKAAKGYRFGVHLAPHDIQVREWGAGGITRYEKAERLGIKFTVLPQTLLQDQIDNTLSHIYKVWIDDRRGKPLVDALKNYFRKWNETLQRYDKKPVHNWASNYASAFMAIFLGLHETYNGYPPDFYDKIRRQAIYGSQGNLPSILRPERFI